MSEKTPDFSSLLKQEQVTQSPELLDQKILAYAQEKARENKPLPPPTSYPGWMPLLAAASMACFAVLVVVQQPLPMEPPPSELSPMGSSLSQEITQQVYSDAESGAAPVASGAMLKGGMAAVTKEKKAVMQPAPSAVRLMGADDERAMAQTDRAEAAEPVQKQRFTATKLTTKPTPTTKLAPKPESNSTKPTKQTPTTTKPPTKQTPKLESTEPAILDSQSVLMDLQALLATGQSVRAHEDYEALKINCPECDLPETLDEALKSLQ